MSIESTLELDDIQSGVLRPRSTPYHATHVIFRIDDRQAGRELIRRLSEVVASAAHPTSPAGEMNGASFFGGSQEKDPIAGASTGDGTFDIPSVSFAGVCKACLGSLLQRAASIASCRGSRPFATSPRFGTRVEPPLRFFVVFSSSLIPLDLDTRGFRSWEILD